MLRKRNTYLHLRNKWLHRHKAAQEKLLQKHGHVISEIVQKTKHIAFGPISAFTLLASSYLSPTPLPTLQHNQAGPSIDRRIFLVSDLAPFIPDDVRPLTMEEEQMTTDILSRDFGLMVRSELEGKRLNRSYGYIGAEQHLARYPGDTMQTHFDNPAEAEEHWSSGMAPGLGAWRYFAPSKEELTQQDALREKYYIAVQTFLSPGYSENAREYSNFFKFRKMLLVNPQSGKSIVTVVGDVGPAVWTGKHLGGSPEVMKYLERVDGAQKGPVLYFFIDDPEGKVPLGPIAL